MVKEESKNYVWSTLNCAMRRLTPVKPLCVCYDLQHQCIMAVPSNTKAALALTQDVTGARTKTEKSGWCPNKQWCASIQ